MRKLALLYASSNLTISPRGHFLATYRVRTYGSDTVQYRNASKRPSSDSYRLGLQRCESRIYIANSHRHESNEGLASSRFRTVSSSCMERITNWQGRCPPGRGGVSRGHNVWGRNPTSKH